MCGLVGVMGHITIVEKAVFQQLLLVDTIRGKHSTGIAAIDHVGDVTVFKRAVNALDFFDFKQYDRTMLYSSNCLMGHNRYATAGEVNNTNAHPFEFSELVGMHNGTLTKRYMLDDHVDFDVDSENLYHHMNKNGVEDTFEKVGGAFALTWFDKVDNKLCFLRNNQRPLCYCHVEGRKTIYWASEPWMLEGILERNCINHEAVIITKKDTLYEFDVPKGYNTHSWPLNAPDIRLLKKKEEPVVKKPLGLVSKGSSGGSGYTKAKVYLGENPLFFVERKERDMNGSEYMLCTLEDGVDVPIRVYLPKDHDMWHIMEESVNSFTGKVKALKIQSGKVYLLINVKSVAEVEFDIEIDEDPDTVLGWGGAVLTKEDFSEVTSSGCCWCSGNAEWGKPFEFVSAEEFVCQHCLHLEDVQAYLNEGVG